MQGARELLDVADQAAPATGLPWAPTLAGAYRVLLWLRQECPAAEGPAAQQWLAQLAAGDPDWPAWLADMAQRVQAQADIVQGRPAAALPVLERLVQEATTRNNRRNLIHALLLQALAWQARGATPQALAALDQVLALSEPGGYVRLFVDAGPAMAALLRLAGARGSRLPPISPRSWPILRPPAPPRARRRPLCRRPAAARWPSR